MSEAWRRPAGRHCGARTPDGRSCAAPPLRDSRFCFLHDPDHAAAAAEARRLGGLRRRRERTLEAAYDLDGLGSAAGLRRVLEIAVADALWLDHGVDRIRVLIAATAVGARLLETGDLEVRLAALEAAFRRVGPEADRDVGEVGLLADPPR